MRFPIADLAAILCATVNQHNMIVAGQTVVVGASGGPDSTALLHGLANMRDAWRLSLVACHVNHGFRGAEADGDAEYVQTLCDSLNIPCRMAKIDVPALQKRRHLSAQQAARQARHGFLRRVAGEVGAECIALAHTRDDRTETVLLNIMRGSGLEGLAGFAPIALPLIRPLFDVTRVQVEQYCEQFHLQPRQDSSNTKLTYRRNRVRAELLPQLRAYYNPKADDALLRLADLAQEDNALLESLAAQTLLELSPLSAAANTDLLHLPIPTFNAIPLALRRRILRQAIARIRGNLQDVAFDTIEAILSAAVDGRETSVELPSDSGGTVRVHCGKETLLLTQAVPPSIALPWQHPVHVPGRTLVLGRDVFIDTRTCQPETLPETLRKLLEEWRDQWQGYSGQIIIYPLDAVKMPLVVRGWKPGDRMRPLGLNGTKKIQDIFTDLKVLREERSHIPLLTDASGERVLAAGEWRADETALFAYRLPGTNGTFNAIFEDAQRKTAASFGTRELLAVLFLYH